MVLTGTVALETAMQTANIFTMQLILGYIAWALCFRKYAWPRLRAMDRVEAHRAIATLHSFRFVGLVFIVPGVVGSQLPNSFAVFAAYADLATAVLALLALLTVRVKSVFWFFVVAFNVVGAADFLLDYYHAVRANLPMVAGQLGAAYVIPTLVVPMLMITHIAAFHMLRRPSVTSEDSAGVVPTH